MIGEFDIEQCYVDSKDKGGGELRMRFFVKSLYANLEEGSIMQFPIGMVWNPRGPPNVSFFAWESSWGKVLTLDQLQIRDLRISFLIHLRIFSFFPFLFSLLIRLYLCFLYLLEH